MDLVPGQPAKPKAKSHTISAYCPQPFGFEEESLLAKTLNRGQEDHWKIGSGETQSWYGRGHVLIHA
ncbi:MAG: hypothetical protein NTW33_11075, partial [Methanoregula sp.]|nr:hypothetical protein [Methanoregula sp.]